VHKTPIFSLRVAKRKSKISPTRQDLAKPGKNIDFHPNPPPLNCNFLAKILLIQDVHPEKIFSNNLLKFHRQNLHLPMIDEKNHH